MSTDRAEPTPVHPHTAPTIVTPIADRDSKSAPGGTAGAGAGAAGGGGGKMDPPRPQPPSHRKHHARTQSESTSDAPSLSAGSTGGIGSGAEAGPTGLSTPINTTYPQGQGINKTLEFLASTERHNQSGVRRRRKSPINYRELIKSMVHDHSADMAHTQAEVNRLMTATSTVVHAVQAQHEQQQQQLRDTQLKATRSRIQRTFWDLSSYCLMVVVGLLIYYDYLMFAPHLSAIVFALLWAILLRRPQRVLLGVFKLVDSMVDPIKYRLYFGSALGITSVGLISNPPLLVIIGLILVFVIWTFILFGDRRTVTALILVTGVSLVLAFPSYFFLKTCVEESRAIADRVSKFIDSSREFHEIVNDFGTSSTYKWIRSYAVSWGWEVPVFDARALRSLLIDSASKMSASVTVVLGGVLDVVSNLGRFVVAVITFMSCLYWFLESGPELVVSTASSALGSPRAHRVCFFLLMRADPALWTLCCWHT